MTVLVAAKINDDDVGSRADTPPQRDHAIT
jgi:hypothetical protein